MDIVKTSWNIKMQLVLELGTRIETLELGENDYNK